MEFKMPKSRVYVLLDEQNRVLRCEGGYTMSNIDDVSKWTYIDEGGACVLRSEAELAADRDALPKPQPRQLDRVEAQATYTAMMTDTMMEG